MADYMSMDTLKFILHEMIGVEELTQFPHFQDYDKVSFDILLDSNKEYADRVLFPALTEMDRQPAHYKDGKIIVHPLVGEFMKHAGENGAIGSMFNYEDGGLQLPHTISSAAGFVVAAANNGIGGYPGLTTGAAGLIATFGDQKQKDTYLPKMMAGKWGGTMCLTEPQAGSSLSFIDSSATPEEDGTFKIKGQKIFISAGDHEYCDNFVHLLLARIDGAPSGTKGISLFIVPKFRPLKDGTLEYNDVQTMADFEKMGQRAFCTTHLGFGDNDDCVGFLVGEANKGLKYMFKMMNGARIDVGMSGVAIASAAYHASLQYAKERPQGVRIDAEAAAKDAGKQSTIINHPDVRRMLLRQKAITEGGLALILQASEYHDRAHHGPVEDRERYEDLLEFLTPIVKTYPAEQGRTSINEGLQIFGGYGFTTDFPLEQYYRDIRIMALYEGTTGIQSLDLMGRKLVMKNGQPLKELVGEIKTTIAAASNFDDLKPYADQLKAISKESSAVIMELLGFAMKGEHERFISDATIFMEYMSNIVIAWQWLKMATVAKTAIVSGKMNAEPAFYESKIHTMKFFYKYELTKTESLKSILLHPEVLTLVEADKPILA